eukprot:3877119-Karenia_brevis.AAC.1
MVNGDGNLEAPTGVLELDVGLIDCPRHLGYELLQVVLVIEAKIVKFQPMGLGMSDQTGRMLRT